MRLEDRQIAALLRVLRETQPVELDCDAFLDAMAACAELRATGQAWPPELAAVLAHEQLCANCREELAALVELLRLEP